MHLLGMAVPAPNYSRVNSVWTDCALKLLINAAHEHVAYNKKWTDVTARNLRQKLNRFKEEVNTM